ncbi:MAG: signal recognition particle protein [Anaerolineales bacterium]|nr:signal recognition particle protein [Anaerolineales bacterium]
MFESLTNRLQDTFRSLRRHGTLKPEDIDTAMREIRMALLEADVHYQVVKGILAEVRDQALSAEVSRALNPAQQVIQILHRELVKTLGEPADLELRGPRPRTLLLVGLQGSGKTTTAAKLARHLKKEGERVWMIAADPYRPAAIDQLQILGEEIGVKVFVDTELEPPALVKRGVEQAGKAGATAVIIDTAGRLQIDEGMMDELRRIQERVKPSEVLLVADAMTGQEAVQIAQGFDERLNLTGLILTKMDGDARGGAAISMRTITGVPIKFIGVGESRDALQRFEPDRLVSRIMGMGDVMTIIEKAQEAVEVEQAEVQAERMLAGDFTLEDFAEQLRMMRNMGPMGKLLDLLPAGLTGGQVEIDHQDAEQRLRYTQAILSSMTPGERRRPELLNASRKRRIASGSGTSVQEVNQLLRQYRQMQKLFKQIGKRGLPSLGSWPRS